MKGDILLSADKQRLPSYLRGNAALSIVVFGQGKKMGAAFSILYLHGVRQEDSIV